KNKGLVAEEYEYDEEDVSSDENEITKVKFWAKNFVCETSLANDTKMSLPGVEKPWLSKVKGFILPNHDIGRILLTESQRNTTNPSVVITNSSATDYNSADESLVCITPLPPLEKLGGAELTFKAEVLVLAGAEDGSFMVIPFKTLALNVEFDFKIYLIVFGPETGPVPPSFSSGGRGVMQTKDSSAEL
nr:hypothetical protein [Tanacetum cinerariifolium]